MTDTQPTAEQIATAQLNGWNPQELADNNARVARIHQLMRKHSKTALLHMAYAGGLANHNQPATWSKQEIAAEIARQETAR